MNIKSPDLKILIPNYAIGEIEELYHAVKDVNNCEIAFNALNTCYLGQKITNDIVYFIDVDYIGIYSYKLDIVIANIVFPNPIKYTRFDDAFEVIETPKNEQFIVCNN